MTPEIIIELLFYALSALIALTVHEYCHGYAAYRLGDDTARNFGRLTLNPLKHIDIYGAICMIFFHIGWAKPVPINARNFKNPKRDFAVTAAAGPTANLILGFFTIPLFLLARNGFYAVYQSTYGQGGFEENLLLNLARFLLAFYTINIGLGLFNLLPIPPFDGSRLLNVFLPPKIYFEIMKYERKIYFGVLAWLLFGNYVTDVIRMIPLVKSSQLLYWFAGIFSLSDIIGTIIAWVTGVITAFWELFPFLQFRPF